MSHSKAQTQRFQNWTRLLNIFCTFSSRASILFLRFWIIFTVITLNSFSGRLLISSSFIWSYRFLPCPFIFNPFFVVSLFFFFDGWVCVPVLLVVWPEASSTGVCRLLGRAQSWCRDEDLQETSLQWIFPGVWGSLLVQWSWLGARTRGAQAQPLACGPRSCK